MKMPLALLLHEKSIPGSKLGTKFEEMDFRVLTVTDPSTLLPTARKETPMLVVADLTNRRGDVLAVLAELHRDPATAHVPIIAYAAREDEKQREAALGAGVKVLATDATIVPHLGQFVEHALQVE